MRKKSPNTPQIFRSMTALSTTLAFVAGAAMAADVSLVSPDGSIDVKGELLEFEGGQYLVRTDLGDLRVDANQITCSGPGCPRIQPEADVVNVSGSDAMANGIMPLLLEGYASVNDAAPTTERHSVVATTEFVGNQGFGDTVANFRVVGSISSDAFANLLGKSADIGLSSRRILPTEVEALRRSGAGNMVDPSQEHIVALDSLVVITHPSNPIQQLSFDQLRGIYGGSITNWSQVGGKDAEIDVVQLLDGAGAKSVFQDRIFGNTVSGVPGRTIQAEGSRNVATLVNDNENAIGYVPFAFQRGAKPLTLINDCGIAMSPDPFSARTEEYALQRFLYMYTRAGESNDLPVEFVNYVTSPKADPLIAKAGFIDLGVSRQEQSLLSSRARQLLKGEAKNQEVVLTPGLLSQMATHDRLSSTFRFRSGSQNLTERGEINMRRLVDFLADQPKGTKLTFAGFTDDVGAFQENQRLGQRRAARVMNALQSQAGGLLDGIQMEAVGYGELAPSACNTSEDGRALNRRVEVWIENANG